MAILQDIRNKAGIFIIIFVGVALFLFIVDPEVFTYLFDRHDTRIARINKKNVEYEEFLNHTAFHEQFVRLASQQSSLDQETMEGIRSLAWTDIIREYIINDYFDNIGLSVSELELEDLLYGSNIHSVIHQYFTNQQTGQLDTLRIRGFFSQAEEDPQLYVMAEYLKKIIKQDRVFNKYNNMISQGFYEPEILAKNNYFDRNTNFNFEYIVRNYKELSDEEIQISESELKNYYNSHIYKFQIEDNTVDIEYVVFDVAPSATDSLRAKEDMEDYYKDFINSDDPLTFVSRFSDFQNFKTYYKIDELPEALDEVFFYSEVGTVSEILLTNNSYFAAYKIDLVQRPDSVNASHILLQPNENRSIDDCRIIADSLKNIIKTGENFEILAMTYSDDPGSKQQGGLLGWFTDGEMVPEFNEACFTNNVGDIIKVETRFGVHIIKINEQTKLHDKVKLAILEKEIPWSEQTFNQVFSKASNFSARSLTAEDFDNNAEKLNYIRRPAPKLKELDQQVGRLENSRSIVQWAYRGGAQIGDVSDVFTLGDIFIVAKISDIRKKGNIAFENIKNQIEQILIKEKKAEIISAELKNDINSGNSLRAIADNYNVRIDTAKVINFYSNYPSFRNREASLIAVASKIDINKLSNPVKGNNGVFLLNVIDRTKAPEMTDYSSIQLSIMRNYSMRIDYRKIEQALKRKAEIEDFRTRWF